MTAMSASTMPASARSEYQPSIGLLIVLAWIVIAGQMLWMDWSSTAKVLGDTDDAMRLLEVREFLAGRGWFDLHEPRLQPPMGYDTHWSRLIDAGLAGLFLLLHQFTDAAFAERLMRVIWPLLWIGPAIGGTIALTWRLGGRPAAVVVLFLLVFGLPAFIQFKPGRIDHHDVQITLAILTLAAAVWADRVRWTPWAAGVLSALELAIGIEGMPFIVLAGAVFAVRYLLRRADAAALAQYGLALAASTAIVFFATIGPDHWTGTACDSMALNFAASAAWLGLALHIVGRFFAVEPPRVRWFAITAVLGLAAGLFVLIEPRCLGGPLAMVDPTVRRIWLAYVTEAQPYMSTALSDPVTGVSFAAYPIAGIVAALVLARNANLYRDSGYIALVAALLLSDALTVVAIRSVSYTIWIAMPFVAAALPVLYSRLKLASLPAMALVTLPFTPALLTSGSGMIVEAAGVPQVNRYNSEDAPCFEIENYKTLARLPAGLIVTDVDYGPFVLALTPHSVLGAPYHRLSYGITASFRAFTAPPEAAREVLRQAKATYVMTCGVRAPPGLSNAELRNSLWTKLKAGDVPNWLERVPDTGPFAVYRFKS